MKRDNFIIIIPIVIIVVLLGIQQYFLIWNSPPKEDNELFNKINNIESKIDSLSQKKDSIQTIIIEIEKTIDKNNKNYEKVVNTILNNDDSANYIWAKKYIEEYRLKYGK